MVCIFLVFMIEIFLAVSSAIKSKLLQIGSGYDNFLENFFVANNFAAMRPCQKWNQQNKIYYRCMWNVHTQFQTHIETKRHRSKMQSPPKCKFSCVWSISSCLTWKVFLRSKKLVKLISINSLTASACNLISDWSKPFHVWNLFQIFICKGGFYGISKQQHISIHNKG